MYYLDTYIPSRIFCKLLQIHRKSGLSSGASLQQDSIQSTTYFSHFRPLVSGRKGNTPPSITRYTISVIKIRFLVAMKFIFLQVLLKKSGIQTFHVMIEYMYTLPLGTMLQKPNGPLLPNISCRIIPKAQTSPLEEPLF